MFLTWFLAAWCQCGALLYVGAPSCSGCSKYAIVLPTLPSHPIPAGAALHGTGGGNAGDSVNGALTARSQASAHEGMGTGCAGVVGSPLRGAGAVASGGPGGETGAGAEGELGPELDGLKAQWEAEMKGLITSQARALGPENDTIIA